MMLNPEQAIVDQLVLYLKENIDRIERCSR